MRVFCVSLSQVFCLEAFLAQTDKEVTNAIADFMDCSIVIPPTEIQDKVMLEPIIAFQKKMLRDRLRPSDTRLAFGDRVKGQNSLASNKCAKEPHYLASESKIQQIFHDLRFLWENTR